MEVKNSIYPGVYAIMLGIYGIILGAYAIILGVYAIVLGVYSITLGVIRILFIFYSNTSFFPVKLECPTTRLVDGLLLEFFIHPILS